MKEKTSSVTAKTLASLALSAMFAVLVFILLWGFGDFNPTQIDASTTAGMAHKSLCCGGVAALLGTLLYILTRESVRDQNDAPRKRPVWFYPLMSGLLSLAVMCVAYTFLGMWPFGEKTAMMVDMHHQYAPLLSELRYDILNGGNPLYTFEVGLGANYLSLFGYYLASPFNLFLLLFPERLLAEGLLCITLLKNAVTGALFAFCVQELYGKRGLHIPLLSVMYSMMMYLLAYSWNIMWLDVVMILPLVDYGFERLVNTGKYLTYVLSLAYALYANYYIGFMVCVFLILYYLAFCLRRNRTGREIGVSFARFAGFSLLAAGLVAALLVPVYLALQSTSAAGGTLPELNNTLNIWELLGRHLTDTSPTIRSGNLPNIYCGVLTALFVPLFACNKGIPARRRAVYMALWLVLFFSFLVNWSDLLWHGLHAPNDLPYRFSFLYSFFLLLMAAETLVHIRFIELRHVFLTFGGAVAYLMLEEQFGNGDVYGFSTVYINLALFAVYTAVLALCARKMLRRRVAYALLLLIVTAEMALGGGNTMIRLNSNEYFTRHDDYVDNTTTEAIRNAVIRMQRQGGILADGDFYRVEFLPRRTCVDTALFHYRGLTSFSSSNYYTTTKLLGGLGYAVNGVNSHLYKSYQPFTDSLLGIRYVALAKGEVAPAPLIHRDTVTVGDVTYTIYENPYALGLGYMVDQAADAYTYTKYDPFYSQNDLLTALTGDPASLYTLYTVQPTDEALGASTGTVSGFRTYTDETDNVAYFSVTVTETAPIYLYADCGAADALSIQLGDREWSFTPYEPYIINAGTVEAGTTVTLTVTSDTACSGNFYVAELDEAVYESALQTLSDEQLTVTDFADNRITGTVTALNSGLMMTSIPYDSGWRVTVDGVTAEPVAIGEGMLGFPVSAGKHTVQLTYVPKGLLIGGTISIVSLIVLIVLLIVGRKRREKVEPRHAGKPETPTVQPIQNGFSVEDVPPTELPPLPSSLEELTKPDET